MLYSPLDRDDEDDFSHLPNVDGETGVGPWARSGPPRATHGHESAVMEPMVSEWPGSSGTQDEALQCEEMAPETGSDDALHPGAAEACADIAGMESEHAPMLSGDEAVEQPADNSGDILEAKKRALLWAAGAHLILLVLLAVMQTAPVLRPASEIVAINEVESRQEPAWKRVAPQAPNTAAPPSMQPIIGMGSSTVVLPQVDFTPATSELNLGTSFGTFGAGGSGAAGGNVSFLGNQGKGSHVVFVVDVSGSMSAVAEVDGKIISRFDLLKRELSRSLNQLRGRVFYQVIYFSHFAWPHNEVDSNDSIALAKYEWDINPGDRNVRIPRFTYLPATPANLAKSRKIIEESNNPGGTNWGAGLLMALSGTPKPDLIFFMTDGHKSDALTWVDEVTAFNARGKPAVIHATAMMEPSAARELNELAIRNGGKFTVVNADGSITKGADFFKSAAK